MILDSVFQKFGIDCLLNNCHNYIFNNLYFSPQLSAKSKLTTTHPYFIGATFLTSKSTAQCERQACQPNPLTFYLAYAQPCASVQAIPQPDYLQMADISARWGWKLTPCKKPSQVILGHSSTSSLYSVSVLGVTHFAYCVTIERKCQVAVKETTFSNHCLVQGPVSQPPKGALAQII